MLSGERLLIVEEEFLIALDIQRVLEGANAQKAVFARNFGEVASMGDRLGEFDLAIVNPPKEDSDLAVAQRIVASGVAVVVCSAFGKNLDETPLATAEFVGKPFSDDALLEACRRAMGRRRQP
jgi:hypothetical protein